MRVKIGNDKLIDGKIPDLLLVGVTELDLRHSSVESITNLPLSLQKIDLSFCECLEAIDFVGCENLEEVIIVASVVKSVTNLPPSLKKIDLLSCESLEAINFAGCEGLTQINLSYSAVKSVANLPPSLQKIDLRDCKSLEAIDFAGCENLEEINLSESVVRSLTNLPQSLKKINLEYCNYLEEIDFTELGALEEINLSGSAVSSITNLPLSLKKIDLLNCESLEEIDFAGCEGLTQIDLSGSAVSSVTNLPLSLKEIYLAYCKSLESADFSGCENLTQINLSGSAVSSITNLPQSLKNIDLSRCNSLEAIDFTGCENLEDATLSCSTVTSVTNLPLSLKEIDLSLCNSLEAINFVGCEGLTQINLSGSAVKSVTNLPTSLKNIYLSCCKSLEEIDLAGCENLTQINLSGSAVKSVANLPPSLQKIDLRDCKSLEAIDFAGCENLEEINLSESVVRSLTNLPPSLKKIDLSFCGSLKEIDFTGCENLEEIDLSGSAVSSITNLPLSLKKIDLLNCDPLEAIDFTGCENLEEIDLSSCINLHPTPELLRQLEEIEGRTSDAYVARPDHWPSKETWIDEAKNRLGTAIKDSRITDPIPKAIAALFNRFTSESLLARSLTEIVSAASPVIDLIEKDPAAHLPWMEEMASHYLAGCVNQPVQGWLEITGFVAAYQEPVLLDKIEASKQILAREALIGFIIHTILPQDKPGAGIEVEFGNALMREVHEKLLKDGNIKKPWLGIPGKMAYENHVEWSLTEKTVGEACGHLMQKIVGKTPQEITDLFLAREDDPKQPMLPFEHLRQSWMKIMISGSEKLTAKSLEIDAEYELERQNCKTESEFFDFASDVNSRGLGVALENIADVGKVVFARKYQEEFKGTPADKARTLEESQELLGKRYGSIETRKEDDLVKAIKDVVAKTRKLPQAPSKPTWKKRELPQTPSVSVGGVVAQASSEVGSGGDFRSPRSAAGRDETPDASTNMAAENTAARSTPATNTATATDQNPRRQRRGSLGIVSAAVSSLRRRWSSTVAPAADPQPRSADRAANYDNEAGRN